MITEITLQESLDQFQQKNKRYFSDRPMSEQAKRFLQSHDIAHIIFGCNTSIFGEGIVKIWTTFGTDLSFKEVTKGYKSVNAFSLAQKFSFGHVVKNIGRLLITIPKAIRRAKQMSKPWPWSNYHAYLNAPLSDIRKEFNIQIIE